MAKLRINCFAISLDGFGAGPNQDVNNPLGVGGTNLHQWFYPTRVFQKMFGKDDGATGVDNDFAEQGMAGIGAWILGRNMFGPIRGAWPDDKWKGWWGDNPPYHTPVFVLTHHPRPAITMAGGTTFHFVTGGIHAALQRAKDAAGESDVRLGGGAGHHPPISSGWAGGSHPPGSFTSSAGFGRTPFSWNQFVGVGLQHFEICRQPGSLARCFHKIVKVIVLKPFSRSSYQRRRETKSTNQTKGKI